jgi:hypothetical protein
MCLHVNRITEITKKIRPFKGYYWGILEHLAGLYHWNSEEIAVLFQ